MLRGWEEQWSDYMFAPPNAMPEQEPVPILGRIPSNRGSQCDCREKILQRTVIFRCLPYRYSAARSDLKTQGVREDATLLVFSLFHFFFGIRYSVDTQCCKINDNERSRACTPQSMKISVWLFRFNLWHQCSVCPANLGIH